MNELYFICAYSHRLNEWARFVITARSKELAVQECTGDLAFGWKVKSVTFLCNTSDDVFMEV